MPTYIVRAKDPDTGEYLYANWSTVVDAPTSAFLSRLEFVTQYPNDALAERMARVDAKGTSSKIHNSAEEIMGGCNRAGDNETNISIEQIVREYREPAPPSTS